MGMQRGQMGLNIKPPKNAGKKTHPTNTKLGGSKSLPQPNKKGQEGLTKG